MWVLHRLKNVQVLSKAILAESVILAKSQPSLITLQSHLQPWQTHIDSLFIKENKKIVLLEPEFVVEYFAEQEAVKKIVKKREESVDWSFGW